MAISAKLEDNTEIILVKVQNRDASVENRLVARNKVTGKFVFEYLSNLGHLDVIVNAYKVTEGSTIAAGDYILVDLLKAYNKENAIYRLDVCTGFTEDGKIVRANLNSEPQEVADCRKVIATSDRSMIHVPNIKALGMDEIRLAIKAPDYFSREKLEKFGFEITKDDGQYVEGIHYCEPGMPTKTMKLNREGNYFGFKTDGDTRTLFNGRADSWEDFKTIFRCAR